MGEPRISARTLTELQALRTRVKALSVELIGQGFDRFRVGNMLAALVRSAVDDSDREGKPA